MSGDTVEENLTGSVHQALGSSEDNLDAWATAVEAAMAANAGYDDVQELLASFGRVSFSLEGHVLRQEHADIVGDPLDKNFIEFHFTDQRLTCYFVGSTHLRPALLPPPGDICQVRPGATTLGELIGILGQRDISCTNTLSWRVQLFDRIVSYYAVIQRSDERQMLLTDLVTDLRGFDVSGQLFLPPAACNRHDLL